MLFNSYAFLFFFLPLTVAGCWSLRRKNHRLLFLTLASWFFYAWWDWRFLPLMLVTTMVDYFAALAIAATDVPRRRRLLLVGALTVNLVLLVYFKYAGFFLDSLDGIGAALGFPVSIPSLSILLPIGISFYTFNAMSYAIDVYRGRIPPTRHLLEYTTFVSLFPHLIAGPIVRFTDIQGQLRKPLRALTAGAAGVGLFMLVCGLVKKLLVADQLAPHVDRLFAQPDQLGLISSWAAAIGYSLQLYFDFSGYSDMAVGLALLVGFSFPQNFDSPFKAKNITDFWRRWHMSLSAWFRDYFFAPLERRHRGDPRAPRPKSWRSTTHTTFSLILTMLVVGLWHGAAWTFVVWGLVHGVALGGHGLLRKTGLMPSSALLSRTLTFLFVVAAFVIFRAPDLHVAGTILSAMAGVGGLESLGQLDMLLPSGFLVLLGVLLVFVQTAPNTWEIQFKPRAVYGVAVGAAAALAVIAIAVPHPFIYFQF